MCGIIFYLSNFPLTETQDDLFDKALSSQDWRGPDNTERYKSEDGKVLIGHNRLKIIDLTNNSNQPYVKRNNILSFNGEIYNYIELSKKYFPKDIIPSDTVLLFKILEKYGKGKINELEGMFSFIFFDTNTSKWIASRDVLGLNLYTSIMIKTAL